MIPHSIVQRCCTFSVYCVLTIGVLTVTGCQWTPKASKSLWPWKKDEPKPTPDRILPVWTDTVLHQTNQPGIRGFGGRIYFYGKENTDPVEVDGSLAIYAFDADDLTPSMQAPLRKYVFPAEQFATHMSKSSIGPSYSIWLPWGEVGGPPKRLSLIARFEGKDGGTTLSDSTIKLLPGVPEQKQDSSVAKKNEPAANPIRLAGHSQVQPSGTEGSKDSDREVHTIDIPPSFQRHLQSDSLRKPIGPTSAPADSSLVQPLGTNASGNPDLTPKKVSSNKTPGTNVEGVNDIGMSSNADASLVTEVVDARTKPQFQVPKRMFGPQPKKDIREGRWIQNVARDSRNP